jgi:hypothetical protein
VFSSGKIFGRESHNLGLRFVDAEQIQILLDQRARATRFIDESDELGPPRKSFDPDRTRPGAQIEKSGVITDTWGKNIEECFAKSVRSRASSVVGRTF